MNPTLMAEAAVRSSELERNRSERGFHFETCELTFRLPDCYVLWRSLKETQVIVFKLRKVPAAKPQENRKTGAIPVR